MAFELTKEQSNAVEANGKVIVSAAAGSGKTAVLVERIINRFTDDKSPLSADRALIVTFTNVAAAELKSKIERRLKSMLTENPKDILLRRQNILIKNASIGTIDSFCINLVRENFNLLSIPRDFKIADSSETDALYAEILDEFINEKLVMGDEKMQKALLYTKRGYGADKLKSIIKTVFDKSRSMPYQDEWLNSFCKLFVAEYEDFDNSLSAENIFTQVADLSQKGMLSAIALMEVSQDEKFAEKYGDVIFRFKNFCEEVHTCAKNKDWDALFEISKKLPPDLPRRSKTMHPDTAQCLATATATKKELFALLDGNVYTDKSTNIEILKTYADAVKTISELTLEYAHRIDENARLEKSFTFDQIEHFALTLLTKYDVVRKDFNNRFDMILVDECQDTNNLQDEIFEILSDEKKQLFMVGDVKQSIYGFRNANPDNFLKRKDTFPDYKKGLKESRVLLNGNFRSRKEICDFINYIFCTFMTKESADIEYKDSDILNPLGVFPATDDTPVEFMFNEYSDENRTEFEAKNIAEYIKKCMENGYKVKDTEDTVRNVKYSDFAILLRGNTHIADYVKALSLYNIPVNININDFLNTPEIRTALSLLKCIDDFRDDISLFTVLVSPIFGFSNEEVTEIRLNNKYDTLYSNLIMSAKNGNMRAKQVCDTLGKIASLLAVMPLDEFINYVFTNLSVIDIYSTFEDGEMKRANLLLFAEYATGFNNKSGKKLREFIRYIESDTDNNLSASVALSDDAVTISTMHKSKGLQYPVCIIAGLTNAISKRGSTENTAVICDDKYGFLFDCFIPQLNSNIKPITKNLVANSILEKLYKEELRLLYVALTRAADKLVLSISVKDLQKYLEKQTEKSIEFSKNGIPFSKDAMLSVSSYADWLITAMLFHKSGVAYRRSNTDYPFSNYNCDFKVSVNSDMPTVPETVANNETSPLEIDAESIRTALDFSYPFSDVLSLPAKTSVTDILKQNKTLQLIFKGKPSFTFKEGLSAAEKGTATHKFMGFCDYSLAEKDLESEIERLRDWDFISEAEAKVIDRECIHSFFLSDVYSSIKSADKVYREYRFLSKIDARDIDSNVTEEDEYCVVQGVADCVIENENDIIILDFKTDNITSPEKLAEEYSGQLKLYENALVGIFKKPVSKKILFSFKMQQAIEII